VALAPKLGRGFITDGGDNSVTIFDLKTLQTLGKIKTGERPDAILFAPASRQVFVMNHRGGTITVFPADTDLAKIAPTRTIAVGGALEGAAVDGTGHLYVNVEDKSQTAVIDIASLKVTHRWMLGTGEEPTGLAIDAGKELLFVTCGNEKMVVLDAHSGRIVSTLPIGQRVDGCEFDPERDLAFASNGDGTLTMISDHDPMHPILVGTVQTQEGARTLALDPATHRLYLPTAEFAPVPEGQKNPHPAMIPGSFTIIEVG
jgi:DNA-binding beta-propeller fold protein YncE